MRTPNARDSLTDVSMLDAQTEPAHKADSDTAQLVRRRIDQILHQRLRVSAAATAVAQAFSTAINFLAGDVRTAAAAFFSCCVCALILLAVQRGRVPERWAGALIFGIWLHILAGLAVALSEVGLTVVGLWSAMLIIAHAIVQLRPFYVALATVLGLTTWLFAVYVFQPYNASLHYVSAIIAAVISFVASRTNLDLIGKLELLKHADERRSRLLAEALASSQRELTERRQAEHESERLREQFIQSQRLEAIGNLAGGVAHDMNNVLSSISTVTALIDETSDGKHRNDLQVIREACERGASLTNSLLGFSRRAQYRKERMSLASAANDAVRLLARTLRKEVRLLFDPGERTYWVEADRNHLVQVIVNLCINSERAITGRGTIRIELGDQELSPEQAAELAIAPGHYAALAVVDDGCGMDEEIRRRVFEPFFTTQEVGKGSGLGLAMAYGTMRAHDGAIRISSEVAGGTTALCLLPLRCDGSEEQLKLTPYSDFSIADVAAGIDVDPGIDIGAGIDTKAPADSDAAPPPLAPTPAFEPAQRVLLVDDERLVRYSMMRALEHKGYGVLTAQDGEEGLNLFKSNRNRIDVVVLDMSMPGMNGAQCYQHLRELDPLIPIVCISGYPLDTATGALMGSEVFALEKPFRIEQLIAKIKSATAARAT